MPFVLRHTYFAKFQLLLSCGIISWGGESDSVKACRMEKKKEYFEQIGVITNKSHVAKI